MKAVGPGSYLPTLADKKKDPSFSMGAKVQTENTKLNVPGAGSYNPPSKVSGEAELNAVLKGGT